MGQKPLLGALPGDSVRVSGRRHGTGHTGADTGPSQQVQLRTLACPNTRFQKYWPLRIFLEKRGKETKRQSRKTSRNHGNTELSGGGVCSKDCPGEHPGAAAHRDPAAGHRPFALRLAFPSASPLAVLTRRCPPRAPTWATSNRGPVTSGTDRHPGSFPTARPGRRQTAHFLVLASQLYALFQTGIYRWLKRN